MRQVLAELSKAFPSLLSSADPADQVAYARDLWPRHHLAVRAGRVAEHAPAGVVWPRSVEEVANVVRWARETSTPLVPFGAGSGVCAGVLPDEDSVVVDLKRMSRWRRLDRDAPMLEVEAGHMGAPLEEGLNRAGFTIGHFPSSIMCSTVGGWVAARSAGQCSGYYGKIEDMVVALQCVTGAGDVVRLHRRTHGPSLVPFVVGSEGTLGIVTSATLRLHPVPTVRAFAAWSFPTLEHGWEAMRTLFQAGLRPAVLRLYDPFDAMLARAGGRAKHDDRSSDSHVRAPGLGSVALRGLLRRPGFVNDVLQSGLGGKALGGALLIAIFEGAGESPLRDVEEARRLCSACRGTHEGEAPAERWFAHRYAINYRQAPTFAAGAFVDTMEVAATWSRLGGLYEAVRHALGKHVFVMAHLSHAYPDGCCIYFSFAGSAAPDAGRKEWDAACETTYDRAWQAALAAAVEAGGTLSHHHGVGRSKAPKLSAELGLGVQVVRSLQKAFDPDGILNPGNLGTRPSASGAPSPLISVPPVSWSAPVSSPSASPPTLDRTSLLALVDAEATLAETEEALLAQGLSLDLGPGHDPTSTIDAWLARGAPGARDAWLDPADHLLAGFEATLPDGRWLSARPTPRRAVGPDLAALIVGCHGRFAMLRRVWLRVHPVGTPRPSTTPFAGPRDPELEAGERALLDRIAKDLGAV